MKRSGIFQTCKQNELKWSQGKKTHTRMILLLNFIYKNRYTDFKFIFYFQFEEGVSCQFSLFKSLQNKLPKKHLLRNIVENPMHSPQIGEGVGRNRAWRR